jgi:hypothetical protein
MMLLAADCSPIDTMDQLTPMLCRYSEEGATLNFFPKIKASLVPVLQLDKDCIPALDNNYQY